MSEHSEQIAMNLLSLADDAGMPDSFWQTDSRIQHALWYLGWSDLTREQVRERLA